MAQANGDIIPNTLELNLPPGFMEVFVLYILSFFFT
jgi:hypothetical protein